MMKTIAIVCVLAIIALSSGGCSISQKYPEYQHKITLIIGGYGYELGDIVLIDTQKEPALGDIVQYERNLNNSNYATFGPEASLAKIFGMPGDNVSFQQSSYEANGQTIEAKAGQTIWGTQKFDDITGMNLMVPEGEFLADKMVGNDNGGEINRFYNRFTVKKEAIVGVILKKLGHNKEFEENEKKRVY